MLAPANLNLEWILRIWTIAVISIALMLFVIAWLMRTALPTIRFTRAQFFRARTFVLESAKRSK